VQLHSTEQTHIQTFIEPHIYTNKMAPPRKLRCSFKECKDAAQRIVGDCAFCEGHFCGKHRLLEDHQCQGLEDVSSASVEQKNWWLVGLTGLVAGDDDKSLVSDSASENSG
jgi:predicted nucleic acid binding AN1-type Zn finger protein